MSPDNSDASPSEEGPDFVGPDFVGVGVQKCGTSWVGEILTQHPRVLIRRKEISFFIHHFHRGYGWYAHWFREKKGRLAGEISVNYMYSPRPDPARRELYPSWNPRRSLLFWRQTPSARDELRRRFPGVRVFAVFRNPVDRAWSHYWFWRNRRERNGKRTVPFERMFQDDGRWIRTQGCYAELLGRWREAFPDMGVFFHDDIRNEPADLSKRIYRFIGVDDSFRPDITQVVNRGSYAPMPAVIRKDLIDTYRAQIERFAQMTGRDLTHWLRQ